MVVWKMVRYKGQSYMGEPARANLRQAEFDEAAILPNQSHWTPATDMTRFTQPDNQAETSPNDESS
jgi:hypothetical protein